MAATLEFIEHPERPDDGIVHRVPGRGFARLHSGAQCLVGKTQTAVFLGKGPAGDVLGPGRHRLGPDLLPRVTRPQGSSGEPHTDFRAAIFYVSRRVFSGLTWRSRSPLVVTDGAGKTAFLKASGSFAVRVSDPAAFVRAQIDSKFPTTQQGVERRLRERIEAHVERAMVGRIKSLSDLPLAFERLATEIRVSLRHELARVGIDLVDFFIQEIDTVGDSVTLRLGGQVGSRSHRGPRDTSGRSRPAPRPSALRGLPRVRRDGPPKKKP